jgi:hypothetical protein
MRAALSRLFFLGQARFSFAVLSLQFFGAKQFLAINGPDSVARWTCSRPPDWSPYLPSLKL